MNMPARLVVAACALAGLGLSGTAVAAPAGPACQLIKDAVGDTYAPAPSQDDDRLDITSADVAVGPTDVVVVLRVKALTAPDPTSSRGQTYEFDFTAKERNFIVLGSLLTGGSSFGVYISDSRIEEGKPGARSATGIGPAKGTVDPGRREIRMVASRKIFDPYAPLTTGTSLYHLAAFTYSASGMTARPGGEAPPVEISGSGGLGVDEAWGRQASYRVGRASCVRA